MKNFAIVILALAATMFAASIPVEAQAESQFRITPAEFSLVLANNQEAITTELRFVNNVGDNIEFGLQSESQTISDLRGAGLEILLQIEGVDIDLLAENQTITIPANSTQVGRLTINPINVTSDFDYNLVVELVEVADSSRFVESNPEIELDIVSTISSEQRAIQLDLMIAVGVALTLVAGISGLLFFSRDKAENSDGKEGN